jgi:hypothetical protein
MTDFSLLTNFVENPEQLVRRVQPRVVPPHIILSATEPVIHAPSIVMAEKTLHDFSIPSITNVAIGPNIEVWDVNFELKLSLINMEQAIH